MNADRSNSSVHAPDSPTDLTIASVRGALARTVRECLRDECPDSAASVTYYGLLSLFPALLVMVSLLGVFGQEERTADMVLRIVADLAPPSVLSTIRGPVEQLVSSSKAGIALAVGFGWRRFGAVPLSDDAENSV